MAAALKPLKAGSVLSQTPPGPWAIMLRSVSDKRKVPRGGESMGHVQTKTNEGLRL